MSESIDIPRPADGWWQQVPVLNKLYRLLTSQDPVNWDLARQAGAAIASADEPGGEALPKVQHEMETLSRAAEVACEEFTGMVAGSSANVQVVSRARWVDENIVWFRDLMEPLARKMTGGVQLPVGVASAEPAL